MRLLLLSIRVSVHIIKGLLFGSGLVHVLFYGGQVVLVGLWLGFGSEARQL